MINIKNFEIFKQFTYEKFENNGRTYNLSSEPYLDVVLTDYCNSKCGFCIGNLAKNKAMGDLEVYKRKILYAVTKMNVKEILLLGGEPTVSPILFDMIEFCKTLGLNKICLTTNGYKLKDQEYRERLASSGITHLNISYMNLNEEKQKEANYRMGSISKLELGMICDEMKNHSVSVRINTNIWRGNLDNLDDLFYHIVEINQIEGVSSMKFSPLLKTDNFSVCQEVNDWVNNHILSDLEYDQLFSGIIRKYEDDFGVSAIDNFNTFGFVRNTIIPMSTIIILNWNQHGQMMNKVIHERKINNIKLLTNGELSLSWNKENTKYFIKTE